MDIRRVLNALDLASASADRRGSGGAARGWLTAPVGAKRRDGGPAVEAGGGDHKSLASPAHRMLCAVGDWCVDGRPIPVSERARVQRAYGYKLFVIRREGGHVWLVLRNTADDVVELNSVIAYPGQQGHGTAVLERLCTLADDLQVRLWLEAVPYGCDREHIPLAKLKAVYCRAGFFPIKQVDPAWVNDYHRWDRVSFEQVMLRNPAPDGAASGGTDRLAIA